MVEKKEPGTRCGGGEPEGTRGGEWTASELR